MDSEVISALSSAEESLSAEEFSAASSGMTAEEQRRLTIRKHREARRKSLHAADSMRSLTGHKEGPGRQVSEHRYSTLTERASQRPSTGGSDGGDASSSAEAATVRIAVEASLAAVPAGSAGGKCRCRGVPGHWHCGHRTIAHATATCRHQDVCVCV